MARTGTVVTPPSTAYNPSPVYSDNQWLRSIYYALTNNGAAPGGGYAQGATNATASGSVVLFRYNVSAPTYTDGQLEPGQIDVNGNLKVTLATRIAGEDLTNDVQKVEQRFGYNNITTAATTVVKSSGGFLHAISVNSKGTVASTITVYDNTSGSGTKIGTIDSLNLSGLFVLDVSFVTGLTIVTTGTVAPDITVSYR